MNKSKPLKRKSPMSRGLTGVLSVASVQLSKRTKKPMKSRGMKGHPPNKEEIALHDAMAGTIGCIACRIDGNENPFVSIHHIDGRTKSGCHLLVLPVCAGHHQDGTGEDKTMIAIHPDKARFEERYGAQMELLAMCNQILGLA